MAALSETEPRIRLYADESGNTGPQLFTPEQPILVVAVLQLDDTQLSIISARAAGAGWSGERELKFSQLHKDAADVALLRDIFAEMLASQVSLRFVLVEKLFFAASFVTETFLDQAYNAYLPSRPMFTGAMRWETNKIYDTCSRPLLQSFMEAAREGNIPKMQELGGSIASRLRFHPDERVVRMAQALHLGLETPFDWGGIPEDLKFPNPITRPFAMLLSIIDAALAAEAELVSDDDQQFGRVLDETHHRCLLPENFPGGVSPYGVPGPLKRILRRTAADSKTTFGVQLADLAAGMIRHMAALISNERSPSPQLAEVWDVFLQLLAPDTGYWEASEAFFRKLLGPFKGKIPPLDPI